MCGGGAGRWRCACVCLVGGGWDPVGYTRDGDVAAFSMLATMGYITPDITGKYPGFLSSSAGLKFADVPTGLAAISKVPAFGLGTDRSIWWLRRVQRWPAVRLEDGHARGLRLQSADVQRFGREDEKASFGYSEWTPGYGGHYWDVISGWVEWFGLG